MTRIGVLAGNPRPASRTWHAALALRDAVRQVLRHEVSDAGPLVDAADLAQEVFTPGGAKVQSALDELARADVLVIATPTYKATYTGLLKAVLDRAPADWLRGKVVVPLQIAASDRHALAVEVHLRPLLVELGGRVAGRGVFLNESALAGTHDELTEVFVRRLDADALNALVPTPEVVL
ncbi:NADPH-dependent FMN reductase [Saccharothrix luteola]|uniref:NADPH-dependent FMN reductase n=1 Tax=Saccharothrix luteola TaxID=2893018 RepID=UPI001E4D66AB|nr:NAD(P)H-dependent oxidoreductase [Saccharothrix luteola]MCC8246686.1 NAD(P)H-dependent oxidoreductase [Saccharothrix luteola]